MEDNKREEKIEDSSENNENIVKKEKGELLKTVPSWFENKFADFTYLFARFIPKKTKPNTITTIGLLLGFAGAICFLLASLWCKWLYIGSIIGIIAHIVCDNLDGYIARNRNMKSDCGAYFDFLSDILFSTYIILFIGLSDCASLEITCFLAPLYGIYAYVVMNYEKYFNEFPFPGFGPFEMHFGYVLLCIINLIFGPVSFTILGFNVLLCDLIFILSGILGYFGVLKLMIKLFIRLKKER